MARAIGHCAFVAACHPEAPAPHPAAHADETAPQRGGVLSLASFANIRSLDPANVSDGLAPEIMESMYSGLVDYNARGDLVADLAESWVIEDGGRSLRFTLRQGVRFHDGLELTAYDMKRSAERALHPSAPNPYSSYFQSMVGYDAFVAKQAEHLDGVRVDGRYMVTYLLKEPDATFLPSLALLALRPVCASGGDRYSDQWHPCGAGPFKLPEGGWDRGLGVRLVRHEAYFRAGKPFLDGIRYAFAVNPSSQLFKFADGEVDAMREFLIPDLLRFQADARWQPYGAYEPERQVGGEAMNTEIPPFDNVEIRRAVAAALNRREIALVRPTNLAPLHQAIPPALRGYEEHLTHIQHYDVDEALEHMRRAGYPYDPATKTGGWPHPIPYVVYRQGLPEFLGQIVAQQLARIGLTLELRVVSYATYLALRGRKGTSAFGPSMGAPDFPDALTLLDPLFHSKSISDEDSNNVSFYRNPMVDALLDQAHRTIEARERVPLYTEAQSIVCDEAPWAFTYAYRWYTQRQPYVRGWRKHPMYPYQLSETWLDRSRSLLADGGRHLFFWTGTLFGRTRAAEGASATSRPSSVTYQGSTAPTLW